MVINTAAPGYESAYKAGVLQETLMYWMAYEYIRVFETQGVDYDIAVRTGNLEVAQRMTQEVIEGALPQFFFHERG